MAVFVESEDMEFLRPTVMDVDLNALEHNFRIIRDIVYPSRILPVVKANAYGHGAVACSKRLVACGADFLGVAFVEEGIELRQHGIEVPILVFGGIFGAQIELFLEHNLDISASSVAKLKAIDETAAKYGKQARVHLKIDTGMARIGVCAKNAETLFRAAEEASHCDIIGVLSHFSRADEDSLDFSRFQLERFNSCLKFFEQNGRTMPIRHLASSSGLLRFPESRLDMVRPGLCLYGVYPTNYSLGQIDLKPVMSLRSCVVYFKVIPKGTGVSYGHTWISECETRIVTIPIGYGDGFFRRLSNKGYVLIRGKRFPIVGTVCMDQMMVDIGSDEAYNGDEVVLLGSQGDETITVKEIADIVGTNTHEVLISTNLRVPRRYLGR